MLRRPLGNTSLLVSPLGLGTVKFGRDRRVKYPQPFTIPSDEDAAALLHLAADLTINVLDTAPAYGHSESRLGNLLKGWRNEWVIITKAGEDFDPDADSGRGQSTFDFSPAAITSSVERSLKRLQTDIIDIVLIHSDGRDLEIIDKFGSLDALRDLKSKGLIRAGGISTKTSEGARRAVESCDVVMLTINPEYSADIPAVQRAARTGAGILVKKIFSSGHTLSAPGSSTPASSGATGGLPTSASPSSSSSSSSSSQRSKGATGSLSARASSSHSSHPDPVATSLRSVFAHPWSTAVSSAIIGTINPSHLRHNVVEATAVLAQAAAHIQNK